MFIVIASIIGYVSLYFSGISSSGAAIIVVLAPVGNGLLAEWEANKPGGFNYPDSVHRKKDA